MGIGRIARTGIAALSVATTILIAAAPAHAGVDTNAELAACRGGVQGATANLHLGPQSLGVYVGTPGGPLQAEVRPGAVVKVTATGRISYGGVFNWRGTWGPDGNGQLAPQNSSWPYPGGPDAALVGIWNHSAQATAIGSNSGCMLVPPQTVATAPYGLWLDANDDWLDDNGDVGYDIHVSAWLYNSNG
jgi:hypothetical protein